MSCRDRYVEPTLTVAALNTEKEKALAACRKVLSELTEPSFDPAKNPTHKYTLRGVSTLPHVTYFRQRREIDLLDGEENASDDWEWWRSSFSREDGKVQQQEKRAAAQSVPEPTLPEDQPGLSASQLLNRSETDDGVGYTLKRVSEEDVLDAAKNESKSVMVVYASEAAVNFKGTAPNQQLQVRIHFPFSSFASI